MTYTNTGGPSGVLKEGNELIEMLWRHDFMSGYMLLLAELSFYVTLMKGLFGGEIYFQI